MGARNSRVLHRSLRETPPKAIGGDGVWLIAEGGRRILDASGGAAVSCLGHQHPRVIEAISRQASKLAYAHTSFFSSEPAEALADQLVGDEPGGLAYAYFVSGGSEAIEAGIKLARQYFIEAGQPQRQRFIARRQSYHGNTLGALAAGGNAWRREPYAPLLSAAFSHVTPAFAYHEKRDSESEADFVARLAAELEAEFQRLGPDTVAAFIAEPIHGGGGVLVPDDDYFRLVREVCTKREVLFIADEVITGFCRTGRWFALSHWNVKPDIMSFAKGVSSGYLPLGGIMVSRDVKEAMDSVKPEDKWMHAYTYSGHPTCCAVGLKNVEIMEREKLVERSATLGTRLHKGLHAAFDSHPNVGDIRSGKGLLAAIELVEDKATKKPYGPDQKIGARILQEMSKRGVITRARMEHVFFSPAIVITEAELDRMVSVTQEAVKAVTGT